MAISLSAPNRPVICHCDRPRGRMWCYVCGGTVGTLSAKQVVTKGAKKKKPTRPRRRRGGPARGRGLSRSPA